jgi:DNA-binding MarR family transcriptional regulator
MSKSEVPATGKGKRGQDGHLGYLLRQAGVAFRGRMDEALSPLDITTPQFVALTMIAAYPGLSSAELARLSMLTPQTIVVIVTNLKRAGAVAAEPHPEHGRIQQLHVTDLGAALLAQCGPVVEILEAQLTAGFEASEIATIRRWLVAVALNRGGTPKTNLRRDLVTLLGIG